MKFLCKKTRIHPSQATVSVLFAFVLLIGGGVPFAVSQETHEHKHESAEREKKRDPNRLWCEEHGVYEDECLICHPELREKGRLWCNEHGRYEDRCWICHPELQDKVRPYCNKHFLYEDECSHLHPEKKQNKSKEQVLTRPKEQSAALFCEEHGVAEHECGICHPELLAGLQKGKTLKVRLPAKESAELIGVKTQRPRAAPAREAIECIGEIRFNMNKTARITAPVNGVIKKVHVDVGNKVPEGTALVSLWSPAIAEAASGAHLAKQTLERAHRLRKRSINSTKDLEQAQAANRAAAQKLQSLGFSTEQIASLGENPDVPVMLAISAPFDGEIVERTSVQGEFVELGAPLFVLTDRSTVWAMLSIPESVIGRVVTGQEVHVKTNSFPDEVFKGILSWVSASVEPKTRMAKARVEVENVSGKLRDNMFVEAEILQRSTQAGLFVPKHAIQKIDDTNIVFVRLEDDLYAVHPVKIGERTASEIEILSGIASDQAVVSEQSFALKSQFLLSRLGAGCVDD